MKPLAGPGRIQACSAMPTLTRGSTEDMMEEAAIRSLITAGVWQASARERNRMQAAAADAPLCFADYGVPSKPSEARADLQYCAGVVPSTLLNSLVK